MAASGARTGERALPSGPFPCRRGQERLLVFREGKVSAARGSSHSHFL